MLVPPINSTGSFTFKTPYNEVIDEELELTVTAIRSLNEILASEEDPYTFIYKAVGRTESEMNEDIKNDVPIVTLLTVGNKFIYVPANMIASIPKNNGILYQDKVIGINLGSLPKQQDLTILAEQLEDTVYNVTGIKSKPELLDSSAEVLIDYDKDREFTKMLDNRKKIVKPYNVKIRELEQELEKTRNIKIKLEEFIKSQFFNKDKKLDSDLLVADLVKGEESGVPPLDPVTVHELIFKKVEDKDQLLTAQELADSNIEVK